MLREIDFETYKKFWERHARQVGPVRAVTRLTPAQYDNHYRYVLQSLVKELPATVIDLACGPGLIVPTVLKLWPDVSYLGMDPGPAMITNAQQRHQNLYPQVSFIQMLEADLDGRKCDLLLCHSLLTHIFELDARRYLDQIHDAIGPSGMAIISIHTNCSEGVKGGIGRIDYEIDYFCDMLEEHDLGAAHILKTDIQTYLAVRTARGLLDA